MGEAVGQVLVFAIGVALSPVAIIATVVILSTPRAKVNGPAFALGWVAGLVGAGAVLLLLGGSLGLGDGGDPSTRSSYIKLGLGILLVLVAVRRFRSRISDGANEKEPGWLKTLDEFDVVKVLGLAVLAALNPKNLVLLAGAMMAITQSDADTGGQIAGLAVFVVLGSVGTVTPIVIDRVMGDRAEPLLARLRGWMTRESSVIIAVICLLIGAKLIGDALTAL